MSESRPPLLPARRTTLGVSALVGLLAVATVAMAGVYWAVVLEPRLAAEARSQAEVLAHSQAHVLAGALRSGEGAERVRTVVRTLDEALLLRDPNSRVPFFESVELQVDYSAVAADEGSLDLRRGSPPGGSGWRSEVAVYDPDTSELLAIAWFQVSDRFFQQLSGDLRRGLGMVLLAALVLLAVLWGVLLGLLRRLERQRGERERAERELAAQERKYQRLVDGLSSYFVYGRDAEGRLGFVSESVRRVLGFSPAELIARYPHGLGHGAGEATAAAAGERVYDVEVVDAQGDPHHVELAEMRVRDDSGAFAGWDGIARDVTAQRLIQEELRHAKEQAEAANRAKSQFLANMSHEIRTPLNAIVGMTALAMKTDLAPRVRAHLEKIRASAQLLTELIEDILDLSRIEAGRLQIQTVEFDLDDLLAELADVVGVRVGEKSVEVLFATAPDVPRRLAGDPVRLKQVLLNLLGNALKFTPDGEVAVHIAVVEARRDRVELRFDVRDTGVGIAAEHLPTLFEPFTQVDASMTRRFGGAGLGLAISRRVVSMMGGELQVASEPGHGSTFSFTASFAVPRGPVAPRRLAEEFHDLEVLVADDNASARTALAGMLESLSCRVTAVDSGEAALAAAEEAAAHGQPYRLAVLDWKMPGLDGAETAERLRRSRLAPPPPVILVTAYEREDAARRAEAAGIGVVLHKPVSPSTLHDAVLRVLDPDRALALARPPATAVRFAPGQPVLLVEDNAINREVARELLAHAGLAVSEAHNGLEALRALEHESFAAVLMDVQMPELDGIEAVRAIRAQPALAALPVIAMTAHAMIGDRERFLEAGMSDYVAKPIAEEELLRVLSRWLATVPQPAPAPAPRGATPAAPAAPPSAAAPVAGAPAATPRPAGSGSPAGEPGDGSAGSAATGGSPDGSVPDQLPGLAVAAGLQRVNGNLPLYVRLVRQLVADTAEVPERLAALLAAGESEPAMALLHTLKGSAATIGAGRAAELAAELEARLRQGEPAPSPAVLAAALGELRESATTLAIRAEGPPAAAVPLAAGVAELLRELAELLPRNDLAALGRFAALKERLGGDRRLAPLEAAIEGLDFAAAQRHLAALAAAAEGAER